MDIFDKCYSDGGYFGLFRVRNDRFFTMPILEPYPGHHMVFNGKKVIQWSINNYLGLAENEELKAYAVEMAKKFGTSAPMGARMMTGNTQRHVELENALAEYLEKEAAILFNYGYLGVLGTIASLTDKKDIILIDKLSHASMVDGVQMGNEAVDFKGVGTQYDRIEPQPPRGFQHQRQTGMQYRFASGEVYGRIAGTNLFE